MEDFKISQEIYEESLCKDSFHISDEIYSEALYVTKGSLLQELSASYKFSGRYWTWVIGNGIYSEKWKRMLRENEMQFDAIGFKYFLSYPDLASLQHDFFMHNVEGRLNPTTPAAYFAFSRYLRRGDVVLVVGLHQRIIAWGIVEGNYMYRPTRIHGRHYRKVSWNKINIPYQFTDKKEVLFPIPYEETAHLQDLLIGHLVLDQSLLPFGFVRKEEELSIQFKGLLPGNYNNKVEVDIEKRRLLGEIIASLTKVVE